MVLRDQRAWKDKKMNKQMLIIMVLVIMGCTKQPHDESKSGKESKIDESKSEIWEGLAGPEVGMM